MSLPLPYYQDESCVIFHGDCRELLPLIEPGTVDLVLTDPPYGVGKAEWDDELPLWWLDDAARIAPVLGLMPGIKNLLAYPAEVGRLKYRWTLSAHLCNGMTRGPLGYGNWIPCLVFADDDTSLYRGYSDVGRITVGRDAKPDHPSPKPYEAMRWLVSVLPGITILDPFMGSGTTLRAAKDLGRKAIGIEIEERYCEIAAKRLAQAVLPLEIPA